MGSQIFDSHKWPAVLVRTVKRKARNFEANLCGSLYSTFKTSFQPYAFYNKRLQMLFIDQLVRFKATFFFFSVVLEFPSLKPHSCELFLKYTIKQATALLNVKPS